MSLNSVKKTRLRNGLTVLLKEVHTAPLGPLAVGELTAGLFPDGVVSVLPGGPMRITLCPPEAAISRARLTWCCPLTSVKLTS